VSDWFRTYGFANVLDELSIGAYPLDADDVRTLSGLGIQRVLNLVEDQEYRPGERDAVRRALAATRIEERRLRLIDYGGIPPDQLEAGVVEVIGWLEDGMRSYVHCRAGWQRSAAIAAGVVALREGMGIDEAIAYVRARKPSADPLPHQRDDLRRWWRARGNDEP
jgi:protein-tyrosine phosphatase